MYDIYVTWLYKSEFPMVTGASPLFVGGRRFKATVHPATLDRLVAVCVSSPVFLFIVISSVDVLLLSNTAIIRFILRGRTCSVKKIALQFHLQVFQVYLHLQFHLGVTALVRYNLSCNISQ